MLLIKTGEENRRAIVLLFFTFKSTIKKDERTCNIVHDIYAPKQV